MAQEGLNANVRPDHRVPQDLVCSAAFFIMLLLHHTMEGQFPTAPHADTRRLAIDALPRAAYTAENPAG